MNLADILKLAGLDQQEPMSSLSSPGSSCNQHMNPEDMRTLVVKIEQPQPEQEMVATEEAEAKLANAPDEQEVGNTHDDFSFKGFGKRKRHTRDALGNYGDNPLEESNMFEMYKNFKLNEVNWNSVDEVEAEYKRLGLDQGDDPLGGWWDTQGMSDLQIRKAREDRIKQAYKDNEVDKQQADFGRGSEGEAEGAAVAAATAAKQQAAANRQAEIDRQKEGEADAIAQLQDPSSASAQQQYKQAQANLGDTTIAQSRSGENSPVVVGAKDRAAKQAARVASFDRQKSMDPNEIANLGVTPNQTAQQAKVTAGTNLEPVQKGNTRNPHSDVAPIKAPAPRDAAQKAGFNLNPNASPSSSQMTQPTVTTPTIDKPTLGGTLQKNPGGTDSDTRPTLGKQNAWQRNWHKDQKGMHKVTSGKYSDGLDRLKVLAGI